MIHPSVYPNVQVQLKPLDPSGAMRTFTGQRVGSFISPVDFLRIGAPVVTSNQNDGVRWVYVLVPLGDNQSGWGSPVGEIKTGPAVLTADAYNDLEIPRSDGNFSAVGVYRIATYGNSGFIGQTPCGSSFRDTGQPADGVMPPVR